MPENRTITEAEIQICYGADWYFLWLFCCRPAGYDAVISPQGGSFDRRCEMEDRRTMSLELQGGERRQILLERGSTVLLLGGSIKLGLPPAWLAEHVLGRDQLLRAEEAWVAEEGGWIELAAQASCRLVIIPPEGVSLWRQVGRCLENLFGQSVPAVPGGK
jgi:hypothetical protein